jgi:hypothetical protein
MACLPSSLALFTSELLAERAVPVLFDGSTMVEGTDCSTIASSQMMRSAAILLPDLKNQKSNQTLLIDNKKYPFEEQLATYLSIAVWEELERFLANNRVPFGCPNWVSVLGVGLSSLSLLPPATSSSTQPRLYISIVYMKSHMGILRLG